MTRFTRILGLMMALLLAAVGSAFAGDKGTADEAKAMVERAIAHIKAVGGPQAYKDFMEDAKWRDRDLYVIVGEFGGDRKGKLLAHGANPKMVGLEFAGIKDADGKEIMLAQTADEKGKGWVDYRWTNPVTKKVDTKSTYVERIPNLSAYVAVGIYK